MRILNRNVELVPIDRLSRHPRNPRRGNIDLIRESITENGFYGAVVAQQSSGRILVGNHRYEAAVAEGAHEVPVVWLDVDDDRALRILLADNRTNDVAGYDDAELAALLESIQTDTGSLLGTGYDEAALGELLMRLGPALGQTDPDDVPEAPSEPITKSGDLWQLGTHRLLCGDATKAEHVEWLLHGMKPQLMVTDPPYGVNYDPEWRDEAAKTQNDSKGSGQIAYAPSRTGKVSNDDRADWAEAWELFQGDVIYVWHASWHTATVLLSLQKSRFEHRAQIVWRKPVFAISRGHYNWQHEPCWYAVRKGRKANWIGDRSQSTIWDITPSDRAPLHPAQKPVECMERPIRNHTGDVYEPFSGTGTTIIAAERQGRTCYAMEIDPVYCDVAVKRWEDYTGQTGEHLPALKVVS